MLKLLNGGEGMVLVHSKKYIGLLFSLSLLSMLVLSIIAYASPTGVTVQEGTQSMPIFNYFIAVISGISSGGFVAALLFFILRGLSGRLRALEKNAVTVETCRGYLSNHKDLIKRIDTSLQSLYTEKVNKEMCYSTRIAFREGLRNLIAPVKQVQEANTLTQSQLAAIQTSLKYINTQLQTLNDKEKDD